MVDSLYRWSWDANAIPDTPFFPCSSQFWSQTRKPKIPDEEFQSDTPRSAKPRKIKKRREISNVGWSQELTEVLAATHVARLQFDSCAEKDSLCGTVMMAWIWHIWINAMVFVPKAQAPPKADAKEVLYSLQSQFVWFTGLPKERLPTKIGNGRHWTRVFSHRCASNGQDLPKASPRAIFESKNLISRTW